jgi:hypothetical protein
MNRGQAQGEGSKKATSGRASDREQRSTNGQGSAEKSEPAKGSASKEETKGKNDNKAESKSKGMTTGQTSTKGSTQGANRGEKSTTGQASPDKNEPVYDGPSPEWKWRQQGTIAARQAAACEDAGAGCRKTEPDKWLCNAKPECDPDAKSERHTTV